MNLKQVKHKQDLELVGIYIDKCLTNTTDFGFKRKNRVNHHERCHISTKVKYFNCRSHVGTPRTAEIKKLALLKLHEDLAPRKHGTECGLEWSDSGNKEDCNKYQVAWIDSVRAHIVESNFFIMKARSHPVQGRPVLQHQYNLAGVPCAVDSNLQSETRNLFVLKGTWTNALYVEPTVIFSCVCL